MDGIDGIVAAVMDETGMLVCDGDVTSIGDVVGVVADDIGTLVGGGVGEISCTVAVVFS